MMHPTQSPCILFWMLVLLSFFGGTTFAQLPTGWTGEQLGTTGGGASETDGIWIVSGDGHDIWDNEDDFVYAYTTLEGDGSIEARLLAPGFTGGSHEWAKAGVMIRESTARESKHAFMALTQNNGAGHFESFQRREITGGGSGNTDANINSEVYPVWSRLVRSGNTFEGLVSWDGINWNSIGSVTIAMPSSVLAGLAVTSHTTGTLVTMNFDNVSINGEPIDENKAPEVNAGNDLFLQLPNTLAYLNGSVQDDGVGDPNGYLAMEWTQEDGPVSVTFDPNSFVEDPQVRFPEVGTYILRLWATDGELEAEDQLIVTVIEPDCPLGDMNYDCKVNLVDLQLWGQEWLDEPGVNADLYAGGGINLLDFAVLARNWLEDWTGSLRVTIQPQEAIDDGAKWRMAGGAWQDSGVSQVDIPHGAYTVEFSLINDWLRPMDQPLEIFKHGQLTEASGAYQPLQGANVMITEFMADNKKAFSTIVEGQTITPDWIEISNMGTESVNLAGWYLTDDEEELTQWEFPNLTLNPGDHIVVFATGIQKEDHPQNYPYQDDSGYYHTNFKLDADGDYLALVAPTRVVIHEYKIYPYQSNRLGYPPQAEDISYGFYQNALQYFSPATPESDNSTGYGSVSGKPQFSHASGTFSDTFSLPLTAPTPGAVIRYTTDGSIPTDSSTAYINPITVSTTSEIMARVYEVGKAPGKAVSRTYIALDNDVKNFNSDIPIVIIDSYSSGISGSSWTKTSAVFIDQASGDGRVYITNAADFAGRCGFKVRGNTNTRQFSVEIWDEYNEDESESIFGFASDSDWVLYGPGNYDRALINNAFAFELSNQIGQYATRTRACEVYLDTGGGKVSQGDYWGMAYFMEKIRINDDRIDIATLEPWDSNEPKVSGGYVVAVDKSGAWSTSRGTPRGCCGNAFIYVDPASQNLTNTQKTWIRNWFEEFEDVLYGPNVNDPILGYAKYIDVPAHIDHHVLNVLTMNLDALRLSAYMYKDRNGKLVAGPVWDFDRSLDSTDGRDDNPETWHGGWNATDYFDFDFNIEYTWWHILFDDIDFWQWYIDRWYELRRGAFSTANLNATIDILADEIREAQARHYAKWGQAPRFGGFQGEIDHIKWYLETRAAWIDGQFVKSPQITPDGGHIESGTTVSLSNPNGTGTIYYTLDGSDPRVFGGGSGTTGETITLVEEDATKKIFVPTGSVSEDWKGGNEPFNDTAWSEGVFVPDKSGGIGYDDNPDYLPYISYNVNSLMNGDVDLGNNNTCFIRIPFTVQPDDLANMTELTLWMRYDDAFIAYLNGNTQEVARTTNAPASPTWNSESNGTSQEGSDLRRFDITNHIGYLNAGENILAIHGLNDHNLSSDFLISAVLEAIVSTDGGGGGGGNAGDISPTAIEYIGDFTLAESTLVKARVLVASNPYSRWSGLAKAGFSVGPVAENLRITEMMYHPAGSDPNDAVAEYIELQNTGAETINLKFVRFTNGIDYTFPDQEIIGGDYVIVAKDLDSFAYHYPSMPIGVPVLGPYYGRLNNGGESVRLEDAAGQIIHDFDYNDGWYEITDGLGFSLTIRDPYSTDPNDWDEKDGWRASFANGGSPGEDDSSFVLDDDAVIINEVLAHSDTEPSDWIEFYNTTEGPIDLGGWFISDNDADLLKYEIEDNYILLAHDYAVFYADPNFGPGSLDPGAHTGFALSENGEKVYLTSGSGGALTGVYSTERRFYASAPDVAFGHYVKSTGTDFVAMSSNTPGAANVYPMVGPVVINEIAYNPNSNGDAEFVEFLNISGGPMTLYDSLKSAPWRFVDDWEDNTPGLEYFFPASPAITLADGEYFLLIKDETAFETVFLGGSDISTLGVQWRQWGAGSLNNGGEQPELQRPGDPGYYIRVDRVKYSDGSHPVGGDPWPTEPDDSDVYTLQRRVASEYGNDVANWDWDPYPTATPGAANPTP